MDDVFQFECWICDRTVDPGEGFLYVRKQDLEEATSDPDVFHRSEPGPDGVQTWVDGRATWQAVHATCRSADAYDSQMEIPLADLATPQGLLRWTGTLMAQEWLARTTWVEIVKAAGAGERHPLRWTGPPTGLWP